MSSTIWKTPYKLPAVQDIDQVCYFSRLPLSQAQPHRAKPNEESALPLINKGPADDGSQMVRSQASNRSYGKARRVCRGKLISSSIHIERADPFQQVTIADAFDDMAFAAGSSTGLVLSRAAMTRIRTAGGLADDVAVADIMWETSSNQPTIGSKNNRCDTYAGAATAQDLLDASCPNAPIPSKPPSPDARAPSEPSIKCKEVSFPLH